MHLLARCLAASLLVAFGLPEPIAAASDGPQVQSIAKKSVRRSSRRPAEAPLPRPKGMSSEETAVAFGSPSGQSAATAAVTAAGTPTPPAAAEPESPLGELPKDPATARAQLRTYYSVSVLADRCSFPVTTREGHLLDRIVGALERQLKLSDQQADALYSDVDMTLYSKGGSKLCLPEGDQARTFRATLDKLH
jgi:hypothetical protein